MHRSGDGAADTIALTFESRDHAGDVLGLLVLGEFEFPLQRIEVDRKSANAIEQRCDALFGNLVDCPGQFGAKPFLAIRRQIDQKPMQLIRVESARRSASFDGDVVPRRYEAVTLVPVGRNIGVWSKE